MSDDTMRQNITYGMTQFYLPEPEMRSLIAHMQREFGGFQSKGYLQDRVGGVFMPPEKMVIKVTDDLATFSSRFIRPEYIPKGDYIVGELSPMESDDFSHFSRGIVHPGTYKGRLTRLSDNEVLAFCVGDLGRGNVDWRGSRAVER